MRFINRADRASCKRLAGAACLLASLLAIPRVHAAEPATSVPVMPSWQQLPYSTQADRLSVRQVVANFCSAFGLRLDWSVSQQAQASGQLTAATGADFMDNLAAAYGLVWFYHAGTLHVSGAEDWKTRSIRLNSTIGAHARQTLQDLHLLNPKFGWSDAGEDGVVVVSGPRAYVDLIEGALQTFDMPRPPTGEQVTVFRLRYANAEDRIVNVRGQQVVVPGVASLLKEVLQHDASTFSAVGAPNAAMNPGPASLRDDATMPTPSAGSSATGAPREPAAVHRRSAGPSIVSDVRLNALLVRDDPRRMPLYETLIAQLDLPTDLVQIEVTILDVNSVDLSALGVNWGVGADAGFSSPGPFTLIRNLTQFISNVQLMESAGNARVLSRPSIVTTDNTLALIDLSQTFYAPLTTGNSASLDPVTAGVMMKVEPRIIPGASQEGGRSIQLVLDIEDGGLVSRDGLSYPVVQKGTISTQAIVHENESLLVGGYNAETSFDNQSGVPWLKNLPLLGRLFQTTSHNSERRERLFLITPRVIPLSSNR